MASEKEEEIVPNPGSNDAVEQGCRCPVLDNSHGIGYLGVPGRWVYSGDCPLHSGGDWAKATKEQG